MISNLHAAPSFDKWIKLTLAVPAKGVAKLCLFVLAANATGEGFVRMSLRDIAIAGGISRRRAISGLRLLSENLLIDVHHRWDSNGARNTNVYELREDVMSRLAIKPKSDNWILLEQRKKPGSSC